jgi:hypothetical protein
MEAYRSVSIIQLDCKGEAVNWAKTITETTQSLSVHLVIYVCSTRIQDRIGLVVEMIVQSLFEGDNLEPLN